MFYFSQLIGKLEEKCNLLPLSHKTALSADSDEIMYTTPGDVGIFYDDNGQNDMKSPAQNILNFEACHVGLSFQRCENATIACVSCTFTFTNTNTGWLMLFP